jgi:hypothetical protein
VTFLPEGIETAAAEIGSERAEWMATGAPAAIITGEPLPPAPTIEPGTQPRRRRFLGIG